MLHCYHDTIFCKKRNSIIYTYTKYIITLAFPFAYFISGAQSQYLKSTTEISYGAGDVVTHAILDSHSKLWFATTNEGVYSYDGHSFTNYNQDNGLCSNDVWYILEDHKGLLYFATTNGLCVYDGVTFHHIPLPEHNNELRSPETGFPSRETQTISCLYLDKKNNLWIGTDASGAYKYDGKTFTPFLQFSGRIHPEDSVYSNCITSILEDTEGNIWFTSMTHGGISRYDGSQIKQFTVEDGILGDMVRSGFMDKSGTLWFGSIQNINGGISVFHGTSFTNYTTADGLCDSNVACFYQDDSGLIWIGTGNGVCYFDGTTFHPFTYNDNNLGDIRFILEDTKGHLWLGGRYGLLVRYDGDTFTDFTQLKRE